MSVALFSTVLFGASVTLAHPAAAQTPLTALSSTGCTDGTYVNTTNDPRVSGDNNDLVEDCLAIVAIQNSWATSANAGLTSGAALRGWGTGLIATWSGLTVETVSGANRVTELESIGRRRGRFLNTQITGVLPADIGKLTALTKISLSGNRLSSIPTEITNLTSLSELNLFQNRITGSIPSAIGSMTALTVLNLANNQISGSIPSGIGRLTSLTELSLYNNSLIGGIPSGVGNLTSLTKLFLDNNSLSGTIPVEIGTATALTRLQLNDNQLTGSIPTQIGSLTALTQLYLNDNRLSGSIPTQLGSLTSLTRLHLDNNRLTGTIPTQLGSLTSLTHLHLNNNELSGAVPTQLTSLSALTELALCSNKLTDNLPNGLRTGVTLVGYPTAQGYEPVQCQAGPLTTLSDTGCSNGTFVSSSVPRVTGSDNDLVEDCVSLVAAYNAWAADTQNQSLAVNHPMRSWGASTTVRLDSGQWSGITVSSNRITRIEMGSFDLGGSIPTELGKLTALQGLDLSGNRLTGSIPTELGSLTQLFHELSLQNNQLSGTIPTQLGSLVLLKEMNLSNNALTGTIPTQLGSLAALRNLNLGRNRLWGSIPTQLSSLSELRQLHLNDNLFSGVMPAQLNSIAAPTNGNLQVVSICNNYLTGAVPIALRTASVTLTGYPTAQGYSTIGCQNTGNPPQPAPQPGSLPTSNIVFTAPTGLQLSQNWPMTIDASSYAADGPYVITCGTPASVSATLTVTNLGSCRYTLSTSSTSGSLSFNIPYTSSGGDTETGTITLTATPRHTISFTAPTGLSIGTDQDITIDLTSRLSVTNGSWTIACSDASSTTNINAVVRNGCSYTLTAASSQGAASFTVTFTSSGGATSQGVITFTVGAASNIAFTAPTNLSVNSGSNLTVNAASYASDGSYTISCGDATDIHAKISSISRTGCSYTVTAGSRGGTATFTVPYTSSGGDTHDGQISITINAASSILFTAPTNLETSVGTTITVNAALYADDGTFTISCGTATSVSVLITINSRSGCSYNITAGNTQGTASFTVPYTSSGSTTATGTISITIGPASDIVFTAPTGLTAQIGVAVVVPAGNYATDGSYTITCADAVQLNPSTGNRETLNLAANNLASISKTDCNYTVVVANNQGATATFTVPYTSSGGDTHFGTISMTITAVTSNIVYTAPTNLAVDTSGTLTISAASYATDGSYTITCGTATESSPLISITSQTGCTITISAGTTTGTATISVRYTSSGGHSLDASITVNVRTPSNIVFTAPSNFSARVGQSIDITASTYATDGSYTITCGAATGDDITNNKISVSNTGCVFRVSHSVAYTGLFSFSTLLTSSGGDTETAVFSVLFNTVQGAIPALSSAGCTDGSYVDTSTDPRVSGNNNDLVEDCLAVVAIQNSWATSSNANLPSTFALRSWGVGKIDTWPALTVGTVSGARRVTEFESNGRRRGRFSDTRITGGLPAEIGNLTALTKLSLSGNRLSTLPTEITNLTSLSELNLFGNRISSSIPSDIGNMTALTVVNLANNQMTGSIPSGIGSLTSLTELSLYNNSLVGGIPSGVGNLTSLTRLFLDNNNLSGSIPTQLGNATALTRLQLNDNQLTGSIPTQLGSLTSLTQLYLNDNRLSGAIPTQLGSLTSLTQLHLDNNRLSGSIPTQLGSLTSLTQLMLNNNELSGAVPSQLGSLSALSRLGLCANRLTDNVPNGLRSGVTLVDYPTSQGYEPIQCQAGPLTALSNTGCSNGTFVSSSVPRVSGNDNDLVEDCIALVAAYNAWAGATQNQSLALDHPMRSWGVGSNVRLDRNRWSGITVSSNRITRIEMGSFDLGGSIPADLGKLTALRGLDLSNNRLSGSIPTELGSLTQLFHELSLQNNQLSGTIPTQLGSLVLLKEMNLSNNALTGTIPTQLGSLAALRILNLGQNRLWGSIPTQLGSLSELRQLHLNDNLLSGVLPAQLNSIAAPTNGNLSAVSICNNYLTGAVPLALRTASVSLTDYPTAQGYATIACQNTGNPPQPAPQPGPLPTSNIVFTAPTGLQLSQSWPITIDASSYATDGPYVISCGTPASVSSTLTVTNLGNCRYTLSTSSTSGALSFNVPYTSSGNDTETGTITLTARPRHTISFTAPTGLTVGIDQDITIDLTSRLSVTSGSWTIACSDASSTSNINAVVRNGCSFTLTAASSQGTASFTVAFTSSGGATSTGVVSFTVGAASNISFTAPTNLSVNSGANLTVNAATYASDGSYTISCGDATDVHARISSISRTGCSYTVTAGSRGGTATFTVPYVSSGGDTEDGQISITINAASSILFTAPTDLETSVGSTITVDAALYADDGTFTISCGTATSVSSLITINSRNGCSYRITAGNTQGTASFTVPYSSSGSTTATGTISITIGPASNILYTAPTNLAASVGVAIVVPAGDYATDGNYTITCEDAVQLNPTTRNRETLNLAANNLVSITKTDCNYTVTVTNNPGSTATFTVPYNSTGGDTHLGTISIAISAVTSNIVYTAPTNLAVDTSGTLTINAASYAADGSFTITCGTATESSPLISITSQNGCSINISAGSTTGTATISLRYTSSGGHSLDATISVSVRTPSDIVFTAPTGLIVGRNRTLVIDASGTVADGTHTITCGDATGVDTTKMTVTRGTGANACSFTVDPVNNLAAASQGDATFSVLFTSSGGDTETGEFTVNIGPDSNIRTTNIPATLFFTANVKVNFSRFASDGDYEIFCTSVSATAGTISNRATDSCIFDYSPFSLGSFSVSFRSAGQSTTTATIGVAQSTGTYLQSFSFPAQSVATSRTIEFEAGSHINLSTANTYFCFDPTNIDSKITVILRGCRYIITAGNTQGAASFNVNFRITSGEVRSAAVTVNIGPASSISFNAPTGLQVGRNRRLAIDASAYASDGSYAITCGDATGVDSTKLTSVSQVTPPSGCVFTVDPVDSLAAGSQGNTTFSVPFTSSGGDTASGTFTVNISGDSTITYTDPGTLTVGRNRTLTIDASSYVTETTMGNTITCGDAIGVDGTRLTSVARTANTCSFTIDPINTLAAGLQGDTSFWVPFISSGGDTASEEITVNIGPDSTISFMAPAANLEVPSGGNRTIDVSSYASDGSYTISCGTITESDPDITLGSQTGCSIEITGGATAGESGDISIPYSSSGGHTLTSTLTIDVGTASNIVFTDPGTFTIGRNRTLVIDASSTVADGSNTITCGDATGVDTTKMTVTRGTGANACSFTVDPVNNLAASAQGDATFSVLFTSSGGDTETGEFTVNIGPDSNIRTVSLPTFANPLFFTADVKVNLSRFASDGDYEIFCTSVTATTGTISNRATDSCIFDYTRGGNEGRFDVSFRSAGGSTTTGRIFLARSSGSYLRSANFPTRTIPVGTTTEINAANFISVYTSNTYFCFEPTNVDSKITVILRGCRYIITAGNTQGAATFTLNFRISSGEVRASTVTVNVGPASDITFTAPTGLRVGRNRTLTIDATDHATDGSYTITCGNATGVDNTKLTSVSRNGCVFTVDPINSLAAGSQGDTTFSVPFTSSGGDTETGTFTVNIGGDSIITYTGPTSFTRARNLPLTIDASSYVSEVSGSGHTITCGDATSVDTVRLTSVTRTANTCSYTITPNTSATAGAATFTIPFSSDGGHSITRTITVNVGLDSALTFTDPGTFTLGRNRTLVIDALAATSGENAAYTVTCADATGVDTNKMTVTRSSSGDGCSFTVDPVDSLAVGSQGDTTFSVAFSSTGGATASGTFTVNIGPDSTITTNIPPATGAGRLLIGRNQTLVIDASDYVSEAGSSYTISCSDARNLTGGRLASVTRTANTCSYTITPNTSASSGQATFTVTFTSTGGHSVVRVITVNVGPNSAITLNLPPTSGANRLLTGRNRALVVDAGSYATESGSGYTITCGDATSIDSTRLASVTHTGSSCSFTVTPVSTLSSSLQATNATFTVPYTSSGGATANGIISVKIGPDSTMTFTAPTGLKVGRNRTLVIDAAAAITGEDSGYTITCGDATGVDASKMAVTHTGSSCSFTVDPVNNLASGSQGDATFAVAFTSTGGATASGTFTVNLGPDSTITYSSPGTLTVGRNRTLTIDASSYVSEVSGSGHTISCANATGVDSTKLTSVTRTANTCSFTITPISTLTPVQQGNATFTITFTSDGGHSITRTITVNVGPDSTIVFAPPASNLAIAASRTRTIDVSAYASDGSYTITCGTITESSALISLGTQDGCNIPVTSAGTMGTATISIPYASSGGHTLTSSLSVDVGATSSIVFNAPTGLTVGTNRTLTIDASSYVSDGGYTISCGTATNTAANVPTSGTVALTSVVRDSSGNGCSYTITPTSTQGTATFTIPYTSSGGDTSSENISITVGPASTIVYSSPGTLRVGRNLTLEIDASSYVSDGSYTITCADATGVDGTKMAVTRTANSCTFTIDPVDALTPANQGATTFSIAYTSTGGHSITRSITVNIGPDSALTFTAPSTFTLGRNRTLVIDALAAISGENAAYTVTCADATGVDANKMTVTRSSSGSGCSFTVDPVNSLAPAAQGDATFAVAYTSTGGATASGTYTINIGPDSTITTNIPPATGAGRLLIGRNQTLTIDASDYVSEAGSSYTISCSDARSLTGGRLASVVRTANTCSYTITPNTSASSGQATFTVTFTSTGGHSVVRVITVNVGPNSAITLNLPPTSGANRLLTGRNRALVVDAGSYATESGSGYTITCGDATSIDSTRLTSVTHTGSSCSFTVTPISTLSSLLQATNATFTVPYSSSGGATATGTISVKIGPDSSMTFTAPTGLKVGRNRTLVIDAAAAISGEDSGYTITCADATGVDASKMTVSHTGSSCSFTVDPVNNLASGSQGDTTFAVAFTSTGGATASGTFTVNIGPDSTITYSSPGTLTVGRNRTLTIDASSYVSEVSGSGHTITCANATGIDSTRLTSVTRTANTCSFTITPITTLTPAQQGNATFTITFTSDGGHSITRTITVNVGPDSTISFMAPASNLAIAASRTRTIDVSAYASDGSYTITCGTITESSALISLGTQDGCNIPVTSAGTMGTATISIPYSSSGGHTLTSSLSVDVGAASSIVFNAPTGLTVGTNRTLTIDASDYASDGGYTISCGTATNTAANVPTTGTVALTSVVRDSSGNGCGYTITPTSTQGTATFTIPYTSAGGDTANGNISITVGPASTISYSSPGTLRLGRNLTLEIDASSYVSDGSYTITCADATGVDGTKMTVTRTANTCTFTIDPVDILAPANQGATTFSIAYTSAGGHSITRSITVNIGPDSALTFTAPSTFTLGRNRTLVIDALAATSGENAAYTVTCADATGVDANKMTVTRSSSGSGCSFTVDPVDTLATGSQGDTTFAVAFTSTGGATASGTFTVNIGPDSTITYNAPTGLQIGRNLTLTIDAAGYVSEASPSNYTISCSDARNFTGGRLTSVTRTANTCSYTIDPFNLASAGNASFTITYTSTGGHSIARAISLRVGPNSAITFNAPPTTGAGRLTTGRNRALVVDAGSYASETAGSGYTITCGDATSVDSTRLASVTRTANTCSFTVTPISTLSSSLQATAATFTVPYTSSGGATATGTISVKIGPDSSMTFTAPGTFTLARNRTLVIDASAAISGEDSGYTITCGDATGVDASKMAVTHTGSSCSFTVDPVNSLATGSQGDTTFAVAFTSTGGATASGTFTVNIGPDSTITYSTPGTLRVGRNQTLTIDASSYVREVSGSSYTITCSDAAGVDTSKMAVTRSANTCSFTIDPLDSLAPANQGATTFRITYTSTGGHSITRSITVNIGPDSSLTFTDPGTFTVGRNRTLVIDALAATSGETAAFTVNCADATGVDTTKMTVTRSSTGNRCSFTVDPVNSLAPASQGDTTFTVAFTSTGGATASGTFTVNIGPDSTIVYTAPTGLLVGRNRTLSVDLSAAATDGSYTVTCSAATNVHSRLLTVTRPDAANSPCVFTVTPRSSASQGTATFRVQFASTGRAASTGTVSLTVGRDSTIVFSAPDPALRVGINRTRVIDALDYARDGNYVISCGDATGVDSTKLTSVSRDSGCGYTITPISTLTQSQQGAASFTVPYTSAGGHTLSQAFSIQVGPASTITYTPPAGANALSVANNRTLTIDASSYVSEAGSGYSISCGDAASIHARIDRITRNGCSFTLTPVAGMTGSATFVVPYTSSGGDSVNGTITVTIGAATEIAFVPPVGLRVAASSSLVVNAGNYATDGSYNITCGEAANVSAILDSVSRTGCSYTVASSASTGAASFTVPYTSSGGDTLSGRIAIRVGAAPTASAIVFAAPVGLTVQAGNAITIDASRYASDGGNTITCGTATGVDTAKISVANTACSYTATATATATGTASFTVPYSSTGTLGSSTLNGRITIAITPASDIVFSAPPTTGPNRLRIGAGNTRTISLASYATDGPYTITCGTATIVEATKIDSIQRNGCDYTITTASSAAQGDTTFSLTYTSSGGDTQAATFTINIGPASNIVFTAPATRAVQANSTTGINAASYARDGTGNSAYTIGCEDATNIDARISSVSRSGCTYTVAVGSTTGEASFTANYTSTGGGTQSGVIHLNITPAPTRPPTRPTDLPTQRPTPPPAQPPTTTTTTTTTTTPDGTGPTTTLEPDQPGPRWNTLTVQGGGTTAQQIRLGLRLASDQAIYTWNNITQTWTRVTRPDQMIRAGTRVSFRTEEAASRARLRRANLGGTSINRLTTGWSTLSIPQGITRTDDTPAGTAFLLDPELTDCRNQQGIIAIASYSARSRRWSLWLPCHPAAQRRLTTGDDAPYRLLTSIAPADTTYIYTRTRQPLTIRWNEETQTYQAALSVLFR